MTPMVLIWLPPERSVYHRPPRPVRFPLPLPSRTLDRPAAARIEAVHWRRAVSFDSPAARCTARPVARATSCRPRASRTIVRSRFASARRASAGVRRHSGGRLPGRRPDPVEEEEDPGRQAASSMRKTMAGSETGAQGSLYNGRVRHLYRRQWFGTTTNTGNSAGELPATTFRTIAAVVTGRSR